MYLEFIQKSLIPTRKILSPSFEGDFPFIGRGLFYTLDRIEKKTNLTVDLFIPCVAVNKKELVIRQVLFYTLDRVEKKAQRKLNLFIPPSGFEPLLRE